MPSSISPTVTVIIATYNKSKALHFAIKSVLWQTFSDYECWVIGDACTDDSERVVNNFADPRLKWFNLPQNSGYQSAPNNEGLRRANGRYIAYLNHDDLWLPDHLSIGVNALQESGADFAYSIMEAISDQGNFADIPNYPDAPRPPEASATLHKRDVVDRIGYWKLHQETKLIPRVDYFRQAQFANMTFTLIPALTALKFDRSKAGYTELSHQAEYADRIAADPDFVKTELGKLLVEAYHKLEGPLSLKRARFQLSQAVRLFLVKRGIDPGRLLFWQRPGQRIENWRKYHDLD